MTKAAVRAMDTITTFCGSPQGGNVKIDGFFVAGGSKR
jgi:PhoPQ-activated pathogenicity-related protein